MTERDKKLLVVFAFVVALGILGIWLPKARVAWTMAKEGVQRGQLQLARERAVVSLRPELEAQYAQLRSAMPSFPEGVALDINPQGELLCSIDHKVQVIRSGEASVRGLYGYL